MIRQTTNSLCGIIFFFFHTEYQICVFVLYMQVKQSQPKNLKLISKYQQIPSVINNNKIATKWEQKKMNHQKPESQHSAPINLQS